LLKEEDLYNTVFEDILDKCTADKAVYKVWKEKDIRVRGFIIQALSMNQITCIQMATTAKEIVERLKEDYKPKGLASSYFLMKKLFTLHMEEGDLMNNHLNTIYELVQWLASVGERISDSQVMLTILISLPPSYKTFSMVL